MHMCIKYQDTNIKSKSRQNISFKLKQKMNITFLVSDDMCFTICKRYREPDQSRPDQE